MQCSTCGYEINDLYPGRDCCTIVLLNAWVKGLDEDPAYQCLLRSQPAQKVKGKGGEC